MRTQYPQKKGKEKKVKKWEGMMMWHFGYIGYFATLCFIICWKSTRASKRFFTWMGNRSEQKGFCGFLRVFGIQAKIFKRGPFLGNCFLLGGE